MHHENNNEQKTKMCVQNDDEEEAKETSKIKEEQKINTEFNCVINFGRKRV